MERFCDELRWERERRQVSIERICAVTKVSQRHVQAQESGEYDELPGGVFRKGILRSYLSVLELDEASWVERFEAILRESGKAAQDEADWSEFAENVRRNRGGLHPQTGARWMGVFAMLLILALFGWIVWKYVVHPRVQATGAALPGVTLSSTQPSSPPR